jgi:hypothetical protein
VPLDGITDDLFHKKARSSDREPYWQLMYEVVLDVSDTKIAFGSRSIGSSLGGKRSIDTKCYLAFHFQLQFVMYA